MCIGVPMRVVDASSGYAVCEGMGARREIDMRIVGDQPPGTFVLVFIDAAREVIAPEQAELVARALSALQLAVDGAGASPADFDHLFPDLADREPELPAHLKTSLPTAS